MRPAPYTPVPEHLRVLIGRGPAGFPALLVAVRALGLEVVVVRGGLRIDATDGDWDAVGLLMGAFLLAGELRRGEA